MQASSASPRNGSESSGGGSSTGGYLTAMAAMTSGTMTFDRGDNLQAKAT